MALFEAILLCIIARLSAKIVKFALSIGNLRQYERNDRHTSARNPPPCGGVALCHAVCRMPVRCQPAERGMAEREFQCS